MFYAHKNINHINRTELAHILAKICDVNKKNWTFWDAVCLKKTFYSEKTKQVWNGKCICSQLAFEKVNYSISYGIFTAG